MLKECTFFIFHFLFSKSARNEMTAVRAGLGGRKNKTLLARALIPHALLQGSRGCKVWKAYAAVDPFKPAAMVKGKADKGKAKGPPLTEEERLVQAEMEALKVSERRERVSPK